MWDHEMGLEFCPECFLMEDFGKLMQRPWTDKLRQIMRAHDVNYSFMRGRAQETYRRAAASRDTALAENNILSLVGTEHSQLGSVHLAIVGRLFYMLMRDFWYKVQSVDTRPPLAERMLIVQLHMVIVSAERHRFVDNFRPMAVPPQIEPSVQAAEEPVALENRRLEFLTETGRMERFDRVGTPDWLIALLGATDVGADDEDESSSDGIDH